ncbi:MAG: PIN domain-containing protein [Bacteroidales bacterium]|nr:PIN domain-containing protein [Bacteroidales bacterium]
MKTKYVTDTMALILRLENRKLPNKTKRIFEKAEKNEVEIYIPAIVLAEIGYLSENNRIETNIKEIKIYCDKYKSIKEKETTFKTIENSFSISDIPELHDRIIAGTALELNLELLTNDPIITKSKFIKTIWK